MQPDDLRVAESADDDEESDEDSDEAAEGDEGAIHYEQRPHQDGGARGREPRGRVHDLHRQGEALPGRRVQGAVRAMGGRPRCGADDHNLRGRQCEDLGGDPRGRRFEVDHWPGGGGVGAQVVRTFGLGDLL